MVVTAPESTAFSPASPPRVAVAQDGSFAAIIEPARVTVIELPSTAGVSEIGVDAEAAACEVAWVGAPPRLVVLTRYAAHSTVHLVAPHGPKMVAEIRLESPMRLHATVGAYALAVGAMGAAVLAAGDAHLTPYQFPARAVPLAAGAAAGQFVVGLAGAIEEWDPQSRMPKRRLKLPRPAVITAVGGSERVIWMTTQGDPTRIDVMPLVNRGQPKVHELPEPIATVSAHPRSDLLVCVGADSRRVYVVDLDGRARLRVVAAPGVERVDAVGLSTGRWVGVVAAQARRPVAAIAIDGRDAESAAAPVTPVPVATPAAAVEAEPSAAPRSSLYDDEEDVAPAAPPAAATPVPEPAPARPSLFRTPAPAAAPPPAAGHRLSAPHPSSAVPVASTASLSERFSVWRDRVRQAQPREAEVPGLSFGDARPSWRDDLVAWSRGVRTGAIERGAPAITAIDGLVARLELPALVAPAIALLYGAHLTGERGAAPVDVALVLGRRWDEALGRGLLAARRVAVFADSRVQLAAPLLRALDELPPTTGTLLGAPGAVALLGACCVIADGPLGPIAARCLASLGGAILIAFDDAPAADVLLEARAIGAAPLLRVTQLDRAPEEPAILVVPDDATADALGLPRL